MPTDNQQVQPEGTDQISDEAYQEISDVIQDTEASLRPSEVQVNDYESVNTIYPEPENWDVSDPNKREVTDPATGRIFVENPDDGMFYPEGSDEISDEAFQEISNLITDQTTVEGVLEASRFGGTEKGCAFNDDAQVGDQFECNSGWVGLAIQTNDDRLIHLEDYRCDAIEIFVKETESYRVEYETSNCTDNLIPGQNYTVYGTLEERKDQWYMGKQQDEWWIEVSGIQ